MTNSEHAAFEWAWAWPILKALIFVVAGYFVAKLLSKGAKTFTSKHATAQQAMILDKVIFFGIWLLFIISALQQVNFQMSVLLGSAGIISAAVGFAAKSSISNLISGVFLIIEKSFVVGDTIKVNGTTGTVKSIDLLSIKIRTFENTLVRVPNEKILNSELTNLTHYRCRRIDILIGIDYGENIERVKQTLLTIAANNERVLSKPEAYVRVTEFANSSVNLRFSVYAQKEHFGSLKAELFEQVATAFEQQNINIPYPQLTLHMDKETP